VPCQVGRAAARAAASAPCWVGRVALGVVSAVLEAMVALAAERAMSEATAVPEVVRAMSEASVGLVAARAATWAPYPVDTVETRAATEAMEG